MVDRMEEKMYRVEKLAKEDDLYQSMLQENKILEERFDSFAKSLPEEKRAILWEFVMHCEDMSIRKLELACKLISE